MEKHPSILTDKAASNEEIYIENVDYFMRVLSLLTDAEVQAIRMCWDRICVSDEFFHTVFSRMISENSELFDSVDEMLSDSFSDSNNLKKHNSQMMRIITTMMESPKTPDKWMVDALRAATLHMLYAVSPELLQVFRRVTMDTLRDVMGEDLTPKMEDPFGRFLDCLVGILDPLNEGSAVETLNKNPKK